MLTRRHVSPQVTQPEEPVAEEEPTVSAADHDPAVTVKDELQLAAIEIEAAAAIPEVCIYVLLGEGGCGSSMCVFQTCPGHQQPCQ